LSKEISKNLLDDARTNWGPKKQRRGDLLDSV